MGGERGERRESAADLAECGSTVCAIKEGMLRGDISAHKEKAACEPIGKDPEIAAGGVGHKGEEREKGAQPINRCACEDDRR